MKDILISFDEDFYIECNLEGLIMEYTFSDDPKCHTVVNLKNTRSYEQLKREINEMYESCKNEELGISVVIDYLQSYDFYRDYCANEDSYVYHDLRDRKEIGEYLDEAFDKVWLMRTHPCGYPDIEARRLANINRIFETYDDIPTNKEGCVNYTDWACGYWNGIMGALRWVLGEEKDFLDT